MVMKKSQRLKSWKTKLKSVISGSATTSQTSTAPSTTELVEGLRGQSFTPAPNATYLHSQSTALAPAVYSTIQTPTSIPIWGEHVEPFDTASTTQPAPFPPTTQVNNLTSTQAGSQTAEPYHTQQDVARPNQDPSNLALTLTDIPILHLPEEETFPTLSDPSASSQTAYSLIQFSTPLGNQDAAQTEIPVGATQYTALSPPRAKRFLEALCTLENKYADKFKNLEDGWKALKSDDPVQAMDFSNLKRPQSVLDQPQSRELISRMKRLLPVIATLKASAMTIAALDPHKIAPICCALLFTTGEVLHLTLCLLAPADGNSWL
jgi:hypothetical protein